MDEFGPRVLAATYDFLDSTISFVELPVVGEINSKIFVEDGTEVLPLTELDAPGSDCVCEVLALGEVPTDEMKDELEYRLRMRMAHANLCEPHIRLKEKQAA